MNPASIEYPRLFRDRRRFLSLLALILFSVFSIGFVNGRDPAFQDRRPSLILSIVVDQMRADYITRFRDLYSGGFKLLLSRGAEFTNCNYVHSPTYTGPGHSVVLSGIFPGTSGIVANDWYDMNLRRSVYCVEDGSVYAVGIDSGNAAGKMSPKNFHGSTIGDELIASSSSSKVISLAFKDRASILPGGVHATGAYWFDGGSGNWITSSYYRTTLPGWLESLNAKELPAACLETRWDKLLPEKDYERQGADDAKGEGRIPGEMTSTFPHMIHDLAKAPYNRPARRFDAIYPTPCGNDLTLACAEAAIGGERLGQRGVTDLLAVSFSSTDYCGHAFGPDSHEVEDMYLRLDRQLGALFAFVDSTVGLDKTIIVLTGDHAVSRLPEQFAPGEAGRINPRPFFSAVKKRVGERFGYNEDKENLLTTFMNDDIYIDYDRVKSHGIDPVEFENAVGRAAAEQSGVARYFTRTELERSIAAGGAKDHDQLCVEHSFNRFRSGGVVVLLKPHYFFSSGSTGTTHGTPYAYDTHVSFLLSGPGVKHGEYSVQCSPNDISATIAILLGLPKPPKSSGVARLEAIVVPSQK